MKIKELLTDETKWTQGAFARTINGNCIGSEKPNAACWCLLGALNKCYSIDIIGTTYQKIVSELHCDPVTWNDAPGRTFQEVKELVERLDI